MQHYTPKISIITPSKNTGKFAKETIESVLAQTYKNWEHIIVDGLSTDETLNVIHQYPHLLWISEEDSSSDEAFRKGLAIAKGDYVMLCCISDGYLDKNWFKKCVEILDNHPEISLVWGIDQNMLEDGTLHSIDCNSWFENSPPNGKDYVYYWLKTCKLFHERNLCIRKKVMEECFPVFDPQKIGKEQGFYAFNYNFNQRGYLPYLIHTVAAYGRRHASANTLKRVMRGELEMYGKDYYCKVKQYEEKIIKREIEHCYRDGSGKLLSYKFDFKKYFEGKEIDKFKKFIIYLIPPIFVWIKKKLLARYRVNRNIKQIRKDFLENQKQSR